MRYNSLENTLISKVLSHFYNTNVMQNCIRGNVKQIYFTFIKTHQRMFSDSLKDFHFNTVYKLHEAIPE